MTKTLLLMIFFFVSSNTTGRDYDHWRIPGVLQRFALSCLVVALLNVWCSPEEEKVDVSSFYQVLFEKLLISLLSLCVQPKKSLTNYELIIRTQFW